MNRRYKLICIDLDGTLLGDGATLSDYNVEVLRKAAAEGAIICLASGRGYGQLIGFHRKIGLDFPVVELNGAYVYDPAGDEFWRRYDLPVDEAMKYLRFLNENNIVWSIVAHYSQYAPIPDSQTFKGLGNSALYIELGLKLPEKFIASTDDECLAALNSGVAKIAVRTTPEEMALIEKYFETPRPGLVCKKAGFALMETMHEKASKWDAIKEIAAKYNISDDQIVVFGDNLNDLEMIQNCPTSFVMSNGDERVFPYATHLAPPNTEDGVAKAIEQHILGNIIP